MLLFGTKKQVERLTTDRGEVKINDTAIELVESARNLDLIMDPQQKYIKHINTKISNALNLKLCLKSGPI